MNGRYVLPPPVEEGRERMCERRWPEREGAVEGSGKGGLRERQGEEQGKGAMKYKVTRRMKDGMKGRARGRG